MSAGRYRQIRGPARTGRPRLHWAESTMTEASHRMEHLQSDAAPSHSDIRHSFFQLPTLQQIKTSHTSISLINMENLSIYRSLRPIALQRKNWVKLVHKPPRKKPQAESCRCRRLKNTACAEKKVLLFMFFQMVMIGTIIVTFLICRIMHVYYFFR